MKKSTGKEVETRKEDKAHANRFVALKPAVLGRINKASRVSTLLSRAHARSHRCAAILSEPLRDRGAACVQPCAVEKRLRRGIYGTSYPTISISKFANFVAASSSVSRASTPRLKTDSFISRRACGCDKRAAKGSRTTGGGGDSLNPNARARERSILIPVSTTAALPAGEIAVISQN